jgi:two-component system, NarL family, response regulator NreC
MTENPIQVVLVDDHKVLRQGLRSLLDDEDDIQVVAEAGSAEEAIEQVISHDPDIVVMDLGLPGKSGLEAIKEIRSEGYSARIIVLSMHSGREFVMQALQAGSDGYVPKSSAHTDLLQAIRTVHQGKRFLHPEAATAVVDELLDKREEALMLEILSEREQTVLRLIAMGYTSREIGDQLSLSPKTVDTYRQRAMEKLKFEHRSEVIQFALKAGLLDDIS